MSEYTEVFKDFLNGKRNVSKRVYKTLGRAYRAVNNEIIDWDTALQYMGIEE